jgi:hypothetical protein
LRAAFDFVGNLDALDAGNFVDASVTYSFKAAANSAFFLVSKNAVGLWCGELG